MSQPCFDSLLADQVTGRRDPAAFIGAALDCLSEFLNVDRVALLRFDADETPILEQICETRRSLEGAANLAPPSMIRHALLGETPVAVGARLYAPLVDDDRLAAVVTIESARPRDWSDDEVAAAQETAERIWPMMKIATIERASSAKDDDRRRIVERYETALRASSVISFAQDRDFRILWASGRRIGVPAPDAIGKTDADLLSDPVEIQTILRLKQGVLDSGVPARDDVALSFNGQKRWFEIRIRPETADGRIIGLISTMVDITERKLLGSTLPHRRDLFRIFIESAPTAIAMFDADMNYIAASKRFIADYIPPGVHPVVGRSHSQVSHFIPENWPATRARVLQGETLSSDEDSFLGANRARTWAKWTMTPWRKANGEVGGALLFVDDITSLVETRNDLRMSQELVSEILEQVPVSLGLYDVDGCCIMRNSAMRQLEKSDRFAAKDPETLWRGYDWEGRLLSPDEFPGMLALRGQASSWVEFTHPDAEGTTLRWYKIASVPWRRDGRIAGAVVAVDDISEQKQAQEKIRLLMREIDHRARNMLSVVQAIARFTAHKERDDFATSFENRICALALNQEILVESSWTVVALETLARRQLSFVCDPLERRIRVQGPLIWISPAAAQGMGLSLHELATNALKHGSLSVDSGYVTITWSIEKTEAEDIFKIEWRECDGPPARSPTRAGFGATVLCPMMEMLLSAKVEKAFEETGFIWRLACPAENLRANSAADSA